MNIIEETQDEIYCIIRQRDLKDKDILGCLIGLTAGVIDSMHLGDVDSIIVNCRDVQATISFRQKETNNVH